MTLSHSMRRIGAGRGLWPLLGAASLGLLLTGCDTDSLLNVPDPDIVAGEVVRDTTNLPSLVNGVRFEFARSLTGPSGSNSYPGVIGLGGILADEMWYSSSFPNMQEIDARDIQTDNSAVLTVFQYVQRARNWADRTAEQFGTTGNPNVAEHALARNFGGYSFIHLAENFCSGVPIGAVTLTGELQPGPGKTTAELLNEAIQRFDAAMTVATAAGDNQQLNLARVGKARALQDLGRFAEAAALAAQVPAGFVFMVDYSENASGQNNGIWSNINASRRSSAASLEGTVNQGLRYFDRTARTASTMTIDPRAPILSRSVGLFRPSNPVFRQGKYPDRGGDVPLATYTEAQLIVAENLLNKGQSAAYLPVLNALRAGVPGLAPLTDPGTPQERVLQLYEERAFWLWLTAHRLGDLRRLIRAYPELGFTEDNVFPTGRTIFGRPYGNDVNMPIPFQEGNNPEFQGECFDRKA